MMIVVSSGWYPITPVVRFPKVNDGRNRNCLWHNHYCHQDYQPNHKCSGLIHNLSIYTWNICEPLPQHYSRQLLFPPIFYTFVFLSHLFVRVFYGRWGELESDNVISLQKVTTGCNVMRVKHSGLKLKEGRFGWLRHLGDFLNVCFFFWSRNLWG